MPMRLAYDVITRWRRPRNPLQRLRVGRPAIDITLDGLPTGGVTLVTGAPAAAVSAFVHDIAAGVALEALVSAGRHAATGVLLITGQPETVLRELAHVWAGVPIDSASAMVDEMSQLLAQLPFWLDDDPFETVVLLTDRVRRLLEDGALPISCVVIDLSSSMGPLRDEVIQALSVHAVAAPAAVVVGCPGSSPPYAAGAACLHIQLVDHGGEIRPRIERGPKAGELLALCWSKVHSGFDDCVDPDADFVAERFDESV